MTYAKANRAAMPTVASFVDELRAQFPSLKVVYASENGIVIDRREPEDRDQVFDIPPGYRMFTAQPKEARK